MRAPAALIVDAAVLISGVLGRSAPVIVDMGNSFSLVTTDRAIEEARRRILFGLKRPDLLAPLDRLIAILEVVPVDQLSPHIPLAEAVLKEAVHSRNGATSDAHILALAWSANADVWSHDRDFAGTGVASWSTINLLRALSEAEA